ncbi:MAG: holo-ACP synthase [Alphaproteobacteria bacterium]|nr:holo-ACP synthase [Alphaproteobacteria bacterium]
MILGIGTDIVDIRRIDRILSQFPQAFPKKIFTQKEIHKAINRREPAHTFARLYAGKEAFIKALGGSFGMKWHDIEILNDEQGKPYVHVSGVALRVLQDKTHHKPYHIHLSLSDDPPYALAFLVIEVLYDKIHNAAF